MTTTRYRLPDMLGGGEIDATEYKKGDGTWTILNLIYGGLVSGQ